MESVLGGSKLAKEGRQDVWFGGRALAQSVQDHEFKPQHHKRNNKRNATDNCLLMRIPSSLGKQLGPKVTAS